MKLIWSLNLLFVNNEVILCAIYNKVDPGVTYIYYNKNPGAVVNRALEKRGLSAKRDSPQPRSQGLSSYPPWERGWTLLPFSKYTKKGVSDYILCIARV